MYTEYIYDDEAKNLLRIRYPLHVKSKNLKYHFTVHFFYDPGFKYYKINYCKVNAPIPDLKNLCKDPTKQLFWEQQYFRSGGK